MKTKLTFFVLIFALGVSTLYSQTTSVASGNWTSPLTWGGTPPMPGSVVIINHTVTLDMDYGYTSGSITINSSGSLIGNSSMRALGISGGTLTNSGTLNIPRFALFSGTITNNGTIQSDSLLDRTTLNNNGGTIHATQFMVSTGGNFHNSGTVVSSNFLNIETSVNNGTINSIDVMNSKSFVNGTTGVINATNDFLNADTLANPAVFTNNGSVNVTNDWMNTDTINGSGKFCVGHNSSNTGVMLGTFDFCDQTGGDVDLNLGSIAPTITSCVFSCNVNIRVNKNDNSVKIYPNPNNGVFTVISNTQSSKIEVFNLVGKIVYQSQLNSLETEIQLTNQPKGIYFCKISDVKNESSKIIKIIIN
ncbi:MAG: T9SS type A sorting domain-containing protein [Bacteroidota bacterium]